jgi:hypothetical protein
MTCYRSMPKLLGLVLLALAMTALSAWCTTQPQMRAQVFGWIGVAFFGLGFVMIARELFRRGPVIVVDELSITDHRSGDGPIFWDQIQSVWIGVVRSQKFLCIELKDPALFVSRWSVRKRAAAKANEALGFPPVKIGFAGLSPGLAEVTNVIRASQPDKFDESPDRPGSSAS